MKSRDFVLERTVRPTYSRIDRMRRSKAWWFCVAGFLLGVAPGVAFAAKLDARKKIQEGIQRLGEGKPAEAAAAFTEADVALPDDPRIAFDRGCAAAAEGDGEKAIEFFQKAALARDPQLAARAQYNLGCVAAAQAKSIFGEKPVDTPPQQRQEGLTLLGRAVGHYRDCLKLDLHHADARSNLETIRIWIKQMQALWSEHDRQKTRDEMNLLQFLEMLEQRQRELQGGLKPLVELPDSPKRRQALEGIESAERALTEEIEPLKEKIKAQLSPAAPQGAQVGQAAPAAAPNPENEKALELLNGFADETKQALTTAADRIAERSFPKALEAQNRALDRLNEIFRAVAPFSNLLQKSLGIEQQLVSQSAALVEPSSDDRKEEPAKSDAAENSAKKEGDSDSQTETKTPDADADDAKPPVDFEKLTAEQNRVASWSEILPLKAEAELKNLEASAVVEEEQPPQKDDAQTPGQDAEEARKQREGLKQSLTKAVELGPRVHTLTREAAEHLKQEDVAQAYPAQQEALKLLKEIAESLPKQNPQQNPEQDKEQQKQQDQQNQGGQKGKEDEQKDQQQKQDQQQESKDQPRDISREQAESVLRKVRERERKHRENERALERATSRPGKVDKDW